VTKAIHSGLELGELLGELAAFAPQLSGAPSTLIRDVNQDSRCVGPGTLFVARSGRHTDGLRYAPDAERSGAAAIMVAADAELPALSCPVVRVRDVPRALGAAAEAVHRHPSRALRLLGITGTNGKTTVAWLVQHALDRMELPCGRIGTLGAELGGHHLDTPLTTPEADAISRSLAWMRDRGAGHAVMEVSSVALATARVEALRFHTAAFTNLTRDHLDFHGTFEAYREAKARLFLELGPEAAVLNQDDEFGRWLSEHTPSATRVIRVGFAPECDIHGGELVARPEGIAGSFSAFGRRLELRTRLVGRHNAENLLVALGILAALGVDLARAAAVLSDVSPAPGRLERCDGSDDDCVVLVDYAHTPDALERVLAALSPVRGGKLICVFGCGGQRDPGKRAPMGRAVGERAQWAILTNDNPRGESPEEIAAAVEVGLQATGVRYDVCLDRELAIERAISLAEPGDVVLLAGKGHETYQLIGSRTLPFDDREVARAALARRRSARRGGVSS
jgi:UDP-N-acetylmuramoyl-L-alanyl-D-glutamate--2,6-diaminopimelate ligase